MKKILRWEEYIIVYNVLYVQCESTIALANSSPPATYAATAALMTRLMSARDVSLNRVPVKCITLHIIIIYNKHTCRLQQTFDNINWYARLARTLVILTFNITIIVRFSLCDCRKKILKKKYRIY
jgi:hypothetical protein